MREKLIDDIAKFFLRTRLLHSDVATDLAEAIVGQQSPIIRAIERRRCTYECRSWRPDGPNASSGFCTAEYCQEEVIADLLHDLTGSEPSGLIQMPWRPIETAPRDGAHVIVVNNNCAQQPPTVAHWHDGGWHLSVNALGDYSDYGMQSLTHWIPLPAPPEAA